MYRKQELTLNLIHFSCVILTRVWSSIKSSATVRVWCKYKRSLWNSYFGYKYTKNQWNANIKYVNLTLWINLSHHTCKIHRPVSCTEDIRGDTMLNQTHWLSQRLHFFWWIKLWTTLAESLKSKYCILKPCLNFTLSTTVLLDNHIKIYDVLFYTMPNNECRRHKSKLQWFMWKLLYILEINKKTAIWLPFDFYSNACHLLIYITLYWSLLSLAFWPVLALNPP